jgi:Flp pilus assembly CpaE family ATPase
MQQALTPIVDRFHILAGPYHAVTPLNVPTSDVLLLIECLRQLADVIVLDVPCTYDPMYFETLNAADDVLLVAEQKVPSIRSLQMIHENLGDKPHKMVLNRYDSNLPGFSVERMKQMLHVNEIFTIVSDYGSVSSAVNQGLPLRLKEPRCKVLADISQMAQRLIPQEESKDPKRGGMLGGLIRALGIKK